MILQITVRVRAGSPVMEMKMAIFKPIPKNPELDRLIEESKARVKAMSSEELETMLQAQRESWVRGEMGWPKPKYKWINGVKVYDSYEDYCND